MVLLLSLLNVLLVGVIKVIGLFKYINIKIIKICEFKKILIIENVFNYLKIKRV